MKIVLLSGGSGKRLWPLSNDARSKQFLRLLPSANGEKESMVQRVVRQITEAGLAESVVVATSASQRDIITNQLGNRVDLVIEPERRDTFPAIALASAYLAKEKQCPSDEIVVVMPCDPYTEAGYFQTIAKMAEAVGKNVADLVLMGVCPAYPSTKFGYIVPEKTNDADAVYPVKRFTEKPDEKHAALLLEQGAFWNGGVFAFRLGYMISILSQYLPEMPYQELYAHYGELPKISFDYQVVEKAGSVAVIPFRGQWKDLGTWNALTEELKTTSLGNVVMGKRLENTQVINELELPMLCDGLKNVVVAASPDGILVCGKESSEQIKDYVNTLSARPMFEERRWGSYKVLHQTEFPDAYRELTKVLIIKAGSNISYQRHHHRDEVWTFVNGEGLLVLDGRETRVKRGDVVHIRKEQMHAIKALSDLQLIEVQMGDCLIEEDIERFPYEFPE